MNTRYFLSAGRRQPAEEIAAITGTMLPEVIVGPKGTGLTDLDRINVFNARMDVESTGFP